jgi:hypothetical protein
MAVVVEPITNFIGFSEDKKSIEKKLKQKVLQRQHIRGHQRQLARKGRPQRSQLRVPICGGMSTADAH